MDKLSFLILLSYGFYLSNGHFVNKHDYLMEQFRKLTNSSDLSSVDTKWITQPIDHFNQADQRKWQMRLFENMEKWRQGGPIYIFIGGEGPLEPGILKWGLLYDLASETNGAMFATEHRYYGNSTPFPEVTRCNLKYLSSKQALADIADVIRNLKQSSLSTSKVIVVGGSYAGNLAAWMRLLYPDLVDAAIASSAPVQAKVDFVEYIETVSEDFKKYTKPDCFYKITTAFNKYREAFKTKTGTEQLKKELNICDITDMSKRLNQALVLMNIFVPYAINTQYGNIDIIRNFCDNHPILNSSRTADYGCFDFEFHNFFNDYTLNMYIWYYQTCTEFGYFMTPPKNEPFGDISTDVNYWINMCSALFGPDFTEKSIENSIKRTNIMYGGYKPNMTKVIFVNGEIDPWHRLSVLTDLSEDVPARVIPGASHCSDLFMFTPEVIKVQQEEKNFIKKWIGLT